MNFKTNDGYGIGDPVNLILNNAVVAGHIRAVTFTSSKVRFAIRTVDDETTLHNIDSTFVSQRKGETITYDHDNYS